MAEQIEKRNKPEQKSTRVEGVCLFRLFRCSGRKTQQPGAPRRKVLIWMIAIENAKGKADLAWVLAGWAQTVTAALTSPPTQHAGRSSAMIGRLAVAELWGQPHHPRAMGIITYIGFSDDKLFNQSDLSITQKNNAVFICPILKILQFYTLKLGIF